MQNMMGSPFWIDFEGMVHHNLLKNFPVDQKDVTNMNKIFGPDLAGVRGNTVWKKPQWVVTDYVEIPPKI